MEKKLSQLFDLQRFQQNPRLKSVLQDVESRYAGAVADDDLDLVSAAGDAQVPTVNAELLLGRHDMSGNEEKKP